MSKIKVGALAVSRYYQLKAFFPINDGPNLSDHDFPVPGYHLSTSGYMFLTPKSLNQPNSLPNASVVRHENFEMLVSNDFENIVLNGKKVRFLMPYPISCLFMQMLQSVLKNMGNKLRTLKRMTLMTHVLYLKLLQLSFILILFYSMATKTKHSTACLSPSKVLKGHFIFSNMKMEHLNRFLLKMKISSPFKQS